ncbi:MAG: hypothetical protein ACOZB3_06280 [Calditrichota bacterium]
MKIATFIIPLLVVAALVSGYFLRTPLTQPTTEVTFTESGGARATYIVDGLKCKGTANFFTNLYKDVPGIAGITTFATEHRAIFTFDPKVITADSIRAIMEAPIRLRDGSSRQVFACQSMK